MFFNTVFYYLNYFLIQFLKKKISYFLNSFNLIISKHHYCFYYNFSPFSYNSFKCPFPNLFHNHYYCCYYNFYPFSSLSYLQHHNYSFAVRLCFLSLNSVVFKIVSWWRINSLFWEVNFLKKEGEGKENSRILNVRSRILM